MIKLNKLEKSLKHGLYIDYLFKNFFLTCFKVFFSKNMLYIVDKYLAEKMFYSAFAFFNSLKNLINSIKYLNFKQILKLSLLIIFQIFLIIIL